MICLVVLMDMVASSCGCATSEMVLTSNQPLRLPTDAQRRVGRAVLLKSTVPINSQTFMPWLSETTSLSSVGVPHQSVQSAGGTQGEASRTILTDVTHSDLLQDMDQLL